MEIMLWALNLAWKVLVVCMGWMLFRYIVKNGKGTFGEFLDTVSAVLRTIGHAIRKMCLSYLKNEESEAKGEAEDSGLQYEAEYAAYVQMNSHEESIMTYEAFCKKMRDREPIVLD